MISGRLLGGGVLGDGLGALTDSVLGQLSGKKQPHGSLDLAGGDGAPLVVVSETAGLGEEARYHDGHDRRRPGDRVRRRAQEDVCANGAERW